MFSVIGKNSFLETMETKENELLTFSQSEFESRSVHSE